MGKGVRPNWPCVNILKGTGDQGLGFVKLKTASRKRTEIKNFETTAADVGELGGRGETATM